MRVIVFGEQRSVSGQVSECLCMHTNLYLIDEEKRERAVSASVHFLMYAFAPPLGKEHLDCLVPLRHEKVDYSCLRRDMPGAACQIP